LQFAVYGYIIAVNQFVYAKYSTNERKNAIAEVGGGATMRKIEYRTQKMTRVAGRLEQLRQVGDETLTKVAAVILEKAELYDKCMASWDKPNKSKFNDLDIMLGKAASKAGLDMADSIVNELRILFLETNPPA